MRVLWVTVALLAGLVAGGLLAEGQRGPLVAAASVAGAALSATAGYLLYEAFQAYRRYVRQREEAARLEARLSVNGLGR